MDWSEKILFNIKKFLNKRSLYDFFDKRGIRCFVYYNEMNGKYKPEIRRKKTKKESKGDGDWEMIRVGFVNCYNTRAEAEDAVFEKAYEIKLYE